MVLSVACTCCAFGSMTEKAAPGTVPCAGSCIGGCCFASFCPGIAFCLARQGIRKAYSIATPCGTPSGFGNLARSLRPPAPLVPRSAAPSGRARARAPQRARR